MSKHKRYIIWNKWFIRGGLFLRNAPLDLHRQALHIETCSGAFLRNATFFLLVESRDNANFLNARCMQIHNREQVTDLIRNERPANCKGTGQSLDQQGSMHKRKTVLHLPLTAHLNIWAQNAEHITQTAPCSIHRPVHDSWSSKSKPRRSLVWGQCANGPAEARGMSTGRLCGMLDSNNKIAVGLKAARCAGHHWLVAGQESRESSDSHIVKSNTNHKHKRKYCVSCHLPTYLQSASLGCSLLSLLSLFDWLMNDGWMVGKLGNGEWLASRCWKIDDASNMSNIEKAAQWIANKTTIGNSDGNKAKLANWLTQQY